MGAMQVVLLPCLDREGNLFNGLSSKDSALASDPRYLAERSGRRELSTEINAQQFLWIM
jgi:hypothetical protein